MQKQHIPILENNTFRVAGLCDEEGKNAPSFSIQTYPSADVPKVLREVGFVQLNTADRILKIYNIPREFWHLQLYHILICQMEGGIYEVQYSCVGAMQKELEMPHTVSYLQWLMKNTCVRQTAYEERGNKRLIQQMKQAKKLLEKKLISSN